MPVFRFPELVRLGRTVPRPISPLSTRHTNSVALTIPGFVRPGHRNACEQLGLLSRRHRPPGHGGSRTQPTNARRTVTPSASPGHLPACGRRTVRHGGTSAARRHGSSLSAKRVPERNHRRRPVPGNGPTLAPRRRAEACLAGKPFLDCHACSAPQGIAIRFRQLFDCGVRSGGDGSFAVAEGNYYLPVDVGAQYTRLSGGGNQGVQG